MASIIAKVTRDRRMVKTAKHFPEYHFTQHKGYGTKAHRESIAKYGLSPLHRKTFCHNITTKKAKNSSGNPRLLSSKSLTPMHSFTHSLNKPKLLLHICCAPDLSWPLHWLKQHFHLQLFWYNPNIHPRKEHSQRYDQFIKLIGLEKGEYDILEDWYDPKEFFQAMYDERRSIKNELAHADKVTTLKVAGEMEERSDRCNPCYSMRLAQAAKVAAQHQIPYFSSTLLISPKKKMDKLYRR
ncbi:MAG: epoxyqueuosine reductase QueH [Candidatus Peribacteria bacterium]|nr:MAG: epoxyqueuosine reductase QueH [Candidatus Peribacteria bacterium]